MRHAAHSPSAREGVFRGGSRAAGRCPGGLRLERTRGTWRHRRHPGTFTLTRVAAHSGSSPGGIRESRDTWRLGGLPEEGFHSALGDRWQSPKGGPAGASAESSNGGIRQGFEKASKIGRVFRGHVSDSEGSPKESRPGWWFSKGLPDGLSKGAFGRASKGRSSKSSTAGDSGR